MNAFSNEINEAGALQCMYKKIYISELPDLQKQKKKKREKAVM